MDLPSSTKSLAKAAMFFALFALLFASTGCSGYRHLGPSDRTLLPAASADWADVVEPGESVRIQTTSGSVVAGEVESVGSSKIQVGGEPVQFAEIETLEVKTFLWEPTAAIVGAMTWAFWLVTRDPGVFSPDAK